jgi:hypothetical protein
MAKYVKNMNFLPNHQFFTDHFQISTIIAAMSRAYVAKMSSP